MHLHPNCIKEIVINSKIFPFIPPGGGRTPRSWCTHFQNVYIVVPQCLRIESEKSKLILIFAPYSFSNCLNFEVSYIW